MKRFLLLATMMSGIASPLNAQAYDLCRWFWVVGGDVSRVWSGEAGDYVEPSDPRYVEWLAKDARPYVKNKPTQIRNEIELVDVFMRSRCQNRAPKTSFTTRQIVDELMLLDEAEVRKAFAPDDPATVADDDPRVRTTAAALGLLLR